MKIHEVCTDIHGLLKRYPVDSDFSFTASSRSKFPLTHWNISTSTAVVASRTINPHLLVIPHRRPHARQDMLPSSSAAEFCFSLSPDFYPVTTKINLTTACGDLEPTYLTLASPGFPRQEACGIFHLVTDYCTKNKICGKHKFMILTQCVRQDNPHRRTWLQS